jgi:diguanylate cyclase (GGDEF)-like protein/putative nucleotidyltransferase with HDIG domain
MNFIDMSDYNRAVRVYWWATAAAGAVAVGCAVAGVLRLETGELLKVSILMSVVFLAGLRPIRVPSTQSFITPGDVFIFLTALFLGAPAATLVAVTDAFAASCRKSRRWTSRIGGPALMSIAILASATVFQQALEWLRRHSLLSSTSLLTTLLLFSLVFFLLNSLLMAVHQALKMRESLLALWWANYSWAGLTYVASASAAGLIYLGVIQYGITLLIAAGPLVAIIFATCHFYFKQTEERTIASERISRMHLATVEALATAIDAKDQITHDHVYRVQVYAAGLARHFKLTDCEIEALKAGALLHDVGKIAVPDYILNKPGKLTAAEFEKMKIHTVVGAEIMERVNFPYPVVPIVRHHHERWDGRGYPDGLVGEKIPITARILTVVDCFDAVREDRQYRLGMTRDQACDFLLENAGKQFDPRIVEAFLANLPKYEQEIAAHKANQQPILSPTTQAGISESGRNAVPAAGLAQAAAEPPRYIKQIHAAHAEVAALYEMAQTFSASLEVRDVVTLTVNRIERMVPFTTCVVYLRDEGDEATVAAYAFGRNAGSIRGRRLAAGHGIAGWVVLNGRPMSNTDPMLDLSEFLPAGEARYRTAAVFPLVKGDAAIGALALYTDELDSYSSDHLHLLESVSRLTSTALQHAMLYEQTKASGQTDSLTGLPDGRALYARFESELMAAKEQGAQLTVLSFNLSGMRTINDAYGYQAGDRALVKAARRLSQVVGEQGLLSRIAGDEFTCLLTGVGKDEATRLGERAQSEVSCQKVEVMPGQHVRLGLSFGVAEYGADGQTTDELLHAAGAATRRNKLLPDKAVLIADGYEPRPAQFLHTQEARAEAVALIP